MRFWLIFFSEFSMIFGNDLLPKSERQKFHGTETLINIKFIGRHEYTAGRWVFGQPGLEEHTGIDFFGGGRTDRK